ncbi:hypothetical protein F7D01_09610 [Erythrobacter sp. 3-20A1M]|uniref:hypothetical protein n=1 Tax=Erythrobacter sp. 3-20A1M TaxID=2653850 RepID=UPI001BFCCE7F|nr:hypothetical protein [Erythrobacter sp. 3-20A1M]QWC57309.1 hypothetical protein F7D01_09610 [Erythrobacter sp. 3-20A1M]
MGGDGTELILVYNADGGVFDRLFDAAHKIVSPSTYPCSLCALTYGPVAMRRRWKDYLDSLPLTVRFLHRDELAGRSDLPEAELPAIFLQEACNRPGLLIAATELAACEGLDDLTTLLDRRLGECAAAGRDQPQ